MTIRAVSTTVALLAAGLAAVGLTPSAIGQSGPGWITLFDGKSLDGWEPVGVAKMVTRAEGNLVHTIDDQPALELYRKYLDINLPDAPPGAPAHMASCTLVALRDRRG